MIACPVCSGVPTHRKLSNIWLCSCLRLFYCPVIGWRFFRSPRMGSMSVDSTDRTGVRIIREWVRQAVLEDVLEP